MTTWQPHHAAQLAEELRQDPITRDVVLLGNGFETEPPTQPPPIEQHRTRGLCQCGRRVEKPYLYFAGRWVQLTQCDACYHPAEYMRTKQQP